MPFELPSWWNWKVTYAVVLVILLAGLSYFLPPFGSGSEASVLWGIITLMLCLIFMLGAAQSPMQFLVFFGTGAFGAGFGVLVGIWLTPSGDSNALDQVRNIVTGVLTGVVGTKLLSLWDDLVDAPQGSTPKILTAPYFVPIALWMVGFTVALSATYSIRSGQSGDVRITYSPHSAILDLADKHIGILPDTTVTFAGAANSPVDVTVSWNFHLAEPCGPPVAPAQAPSKADVEAQAAAFKPGTGVLTTPSQTILQDWINKCPGFQNWVLTATSNQDHSRTATYNVKLCRTKQDCPPTPTSGATPAAQPTASGGGAGSSGPSGGSAAPVAPGATPPEAPKGADKKDQAKGK